MKIYLALAAVANFVFVLMMVFGPQWSVCLAVITALILFAFDIGSPRPLLMVGSLFNFIGVVSGGLTGSEPVMYIALIGSQFLFTDHVSQYIITKKKRNSAMSEL